MEATNPSVGLTQTRSRDRKGAVQGRELRLARRAQNIAETTDRGEWQSAYFPTFFRMAST